MHYQNDLFSPALKRSRHTQPRLYDRTSPPTVAGLHCEECRRPMIRTESGFISCPLGHGRLAEDVDTNRAAEAQLERDLLYGTD